MSFVRRSVKVKTVEYITWGTFIANGYKKKDGEKAKERRC
jgi:hypothetical protein